MIIYIKMKIYIIFYY